MKQVSKPRYPIITIINPKHRKIIPKNKIRDPLEVLKEIHSRNGEMTSIFPIMSVKNVEKEVYVNDEYKKKDLEISDKDIVKTRRYCTMQIENDVLSPQISKGDIITVKLGAEEFDGNICLVKIGKYICCVVVNLHKDGISLRWFGNNYESMSFTNLQILRLPIVILGVIIM